MKLTTSQFIEKAKSIHGNRYDYSKTEYVNCKTKVEIICKKHGSFFQTPDKHINGSCGCPQCAGNVLGTTTSFVEKAKAVHGDRYDYSLVEYVNSKTPVKIVCKEHGVFLQSPSCHLAGANCPYCGGHVKSSTEEFIKKAKHIHGDRYDYSKVDYVNNRTPVTIICKEHGEFQQVPFVHLKGCNCPDCGRILIGQNRDAIAAMKNVQKTFKQKYGVENPMLNPEIRMKHKKIVSSSDVNQKRIFTKSKNNSFNTSLCEYRLYLLLISHFGENDVIRNYKSEVYPFMCDFYIKSLDLYIELNAHWSHGDHWFNSCSKQDCDIIDSWKLKNSKYYDNAIVTWSVRDLKKRNIATKHKLNYVVFWHQDLSDAKLWFEKDCPLGQDWLKEYSWL